MDVCRQTITAKVSHQKWCKVSQQKSQSYVVRQSPQKFRASSFQLPSISHTCFFDSTKLYKRLPLFAAFFAYEVAQSLHENNMSGANTRSVLARFGGNNWEKGKDFVKTFYVKKLVWEMEGSLSERARWMTCKTVRSCCEKGIETKHYKSR